MQSSFSAIAIEMHRHWSHFMPARLRMRQRTGSNDEMEYGAMILYHGHLPLLFPF